MKVEFIVSYGLCPICDRKYQEILELLNDNPFVKDVVVHDMTEKEYPFYYEYSTKYGFIDVPMLVVNGEIVFNYIPGRKELFKMLSKHKNKECNVIDQNQILLY